MNLLKNMDSYASTKKMKSPAA